MASKETKLKLSDIKTLAMLKMEKNCIAQDKGKPRHPYSSFGMPFLLRRLQEEVKELVDAYSMFDFQKAKTECADVSNIVDYIFERITNLR